MSRLIKLRLGLAAVIPDELSRKLGLEEGQEVTVKESKFGLFINPVKEKGMAQPAEFTKEETEIINKLLAMKFADRTPDNVNRSLSASEKRVLSALIDEGAVNIFSSQKYKEGVYNVRDKAYAMIKKQEKGPGKEREARQAPAEKSAEKVTEKKTEKATEKKEKEEIEEIEDPVRRLEKQGYLLVDTDSEARKLSEDLAYRIRKKEIMGIRGFDKKYYILKSTFFSKNQGKIRAALKPGKKTVDQISEDTGLDKQACTAILAILNDNSEVIEKRRGVFALFD